MLNAFSSKMDNLLEEGRRSIVSFKQDCHQVFGSKTDSIEHYNLIRTDYNDASWRFDEYLVVRAEDVASSPAEHPDGYVWTNAIITDAKHLAICLCTADCLPMTLYDPKLHILALAHLGWQATMQHLIDQILAGMRQFFGSHPADIKVFIGPSIKKESYIFDNPEQLKMPQWKGYLHPTADGYGIDLVGYNLNRLAENSIDPSNIQVSPVDTALSRDYESHYSHTKQGRPKARRFLNISMLR